ncbi:hypothetical protein ABZ654_00010 [Streptomyces hygroscopicus]|uniref:hypothetical protein n=1 Tax=Streptomyces hygroscopicus TaxID=1912 RepID=UPI0033E559E8
MTLLSLETTAPVLMRAGIWPLHPFADPGMVQLGEWLPLHWRELKQLQRRRLASLGLSPDVTESRVRESFAEVVQHSLTTHARQLFARMLIDGSPRRGFPVPGAPPGTLRPGGEPRHAAEPYIDTVPRPFGEQPAAGVRSRRTPPGPRPVPG